MRDMIQKTFSKVYMELHFYAKNRSRYSPFRRFWEGGEGGGGDFV